MHLHGQESISLSESLAGNILLRVIAYSLASLPVNPGTGSITSQGFGWEGHLQSSPCWAQSAVRAQGCLALRQILVFSLPSGSTLSSGCRSQGLLYWDTLLKPSPLPRLFSSLRYPSLFLVLTMGNTQFALPKEFPSELEGSETY